MPIGISSVQNNILAMNTSRMLGINTKSMAKTTEKLSSGYRVNRAADDAAGLAISEKMRRQIRGLDQGKNNIQDGISAAQIMDGSLNEVQDILNRMTELSVKAANGTLDDDDRRAIDEEIQQLRLELTRTTQSANFNEKQLLSAVDYTENTTSKTGGKVDIVFLIDNTGSMTGIINNVTSNLGAFVDGLANCDAQYSVISYGDISEGASQVYPFTSNAKVLKSNMTDMKRTGGGDGPESALEGIEDALAMLKNSGRAEASKQIILVTDADYHYSGDGSISTLSKAGVTDDIKAANVTLSSVIEIGYSGYYDTLTNGKILDINSNFHTSLMTLSGDIAAAAGETIHKNPEDIRIQCSGEPDDYMYLRTYNVNADTLGLANLSCKTQDEASEAIGAVKEAARIVAGIRSNIGADQNRLEHAYNTNYNTSENTQASESLIRDADMAKEMVNFSLSNILNQAGQAMLSQANQSQQGVLSLLQ